MIRIAVLLCLASPALAQQINVNQAVAPFQEQRNAALDAAAFCSINLTQAQAEIADLKKKLAEAEAKLSPAPPSKE